VVRLAQGLQSGAIFGGDTHADEDQVEVRRAGPPEQLREVLLADRGRVVLAVSEHHQLESSRGVGVRSAVLDLLRDGIPHGGATTSLNGGQHAPHRGDVALAAHREDLVDTLRERPHRN